MLRAVYLSGRGEIIIGVIAESFWRAAARLLSRRFVRSTGSATSVFRWAKPTLTQHPSGTWIWAYPTPLGGMGVYRDRGSFSRYRDLI